MLENLRRALAKSSSNNEISLRLPAAICFVPATVAISGFYPARGLIPNTSRGRREGERRRRIERWDVRAKMWCQAELLPQLPLRSQPLQLLASVQIVVKIKVKQIILINI